MTGKLNIVLSIGCVAILIFIVKKKRSKYMKKNNEIRMDEKTMEMVSKVAVEKPVLARENGLTQAEVNELTERFRGMSREEMNLFMDIVPIELCLNRIHKELDRARKFEESIKGVMSNLE